MKVEPGELRHYVELQRPTEDVKATGQRKLVYSTYAYEWAGFQPQSMSHSESSDIAGARASQTRLLIKMRQRSDVLPNHRIKWDDGRYFNVIGVLNVFELNDEMVLACTQVI